MSFKRFGITHLSPSAINCWRETPGIWCLRYLARVQDEGSPATWRGKAVELGFEHMLRGADEAAAIETANAHFLQQAQGELREDTEDELRRIPGMVQTCRRAMADLAAYGGLAASQLRVETWLDGVSVPVIGYVDFTFFDGPDVDLKTTKACPSEPRPEHVRQVALYHRARGRSAALLYVTDKKYALYTPPPDALEAAIYELASAARSLERFLSVMPDADTAIRCMPMNQEHYAFSPAYRQKLMELNEAF